jgi:DNA-binding SARP family transcriptional activator/TolB-like protein
LIPTDPPVLTLHLLGDPVLLGPDGPVRGRAAYKRRIALLGILALARGRPVGRERLLGLLWPDQPEDSARHVLSETLYVLRKELGDEAVVPVGSDVALNPARIASDVAAFEEALEGGRPEDAVAAYGGPLLDGFYVADAPEFGRWVDGERDRLGRAFARALEGLAETAETSGDHLRAADWWARLCAHDPFSSRTALRLVRCLDAAGERARALRAADTHAALMRAELEVEPDGELLDYVERLRREPPRRVPPAPRVRAAWTEAEQAVVTETALAPPAAAERTDSVDEAAAPVAVDSAVDSADVRSHDVPSAAVPAMRIAPTDAEADRSPGPASASTGGSGPMDVRVGAEGTAGRSAEGTGTPRWRRAGVLAWAVVGVVLGLAAALGLERRGSAANAAPKYDPRRIAVLYFDDHTPGGGLGYLANGLTEMLLHDLSQVEALDVVPRNGVKPYRDRPVPFDSLVAALRAGSVVEGSVQRSGDSVRVTVQLIDANSEKHLESRVIVRPLRELFALEDTLAEEVAGALRRRLGQEVRMRQTRAETRSDRALSLLLQGEEAREEARGLDEQPDARDAAGAAPMLLRADSLLARAMEADRGWARPALDRGWVAVDLAGVRGDPAALRTALARADAVLARDPGSAAALELRGAALFLQAVLARGADPAALMNGAERSLRASVAAEPTLASAWARLSQVLRVRGKLAEGDMAARRALREDAYLEDADEVLLRLFSSAVMRGALKEAGETCGEGARRFPGDWRFRECRLTLMREDRAAPPDPAAAWSVVAELERLDPAERARAEGRAYSPIYRQAIAAAILARAGARDTARAVVARARRAAEGDAELRLSLDYDEAYVRLALGEPAEARRLLAEMLRARPALRPFLDRDPLFRGLLSPAAAAPATSAGSRAGAAH